MIEGKTYNHVVLLGSGKLFLDCMSYVSKLGIPYAGYDMSGKPQKVTQAQAADRGLRYFQEEKKEVYEMLRESKDRLLLLSVINPCILPGDILEKENITALNCHQALLPRHKGRNAEAWAIFEGDAKTGITWHKMTADVDGGDVLCQKEIPILETTTSFRLFRLQLTAALEAFTEFMPQVLSGTETYFDQEKIVGSEKFFMQEETSGSSFHYSWEVPAGGHLNPAWSREKISRFLRAMDYGVLKIMPDPAICIENRTYTFRSYKMEKTDGEDESPIFIEKNTIKFIRQNCKFTLLKCKEEINHEGKIN